ncbi:MAG: HD domain-containing phosphohydrolase [Thiogranum sp.]
MVSNLLPIDRGLRWLIGFTILFVSFRFQSWWMLLPALLILYSAATNYCAVYHFLKINRQLSRNNYYLSQLPRFNPEPVCIFNDKGQAVFCNSSAEKKFGAFKHLFQITGEELIDPRKLISSENEFTCRYSRNGKHYLFAMIGSIEINSVLAYGFDISEVIETNKGIIDTQKEITYILGEMAESRSMETGNHVKRLAEYSRLLALHYGLSEEEANLLRDASPMHDIGKVAIPDSILNKPGKLTEDEWRIMRQHTEKGYQLFKNSNRPILKTAAIVSYQHHEKWDGSGYPRGFSGEEIHIFGRITAVADVFDALGSDRVYKKAWDLELFDNLDEFIAVRDKFKDYYAAKPEPLVSTLPKEVPRLISA